MVRIKDGFKGARAFVLPRHSVEFMESNPISKGLHITDIGYYPSALHHYRERMVPINQYVLIYCVKGAGWYSTEGRRCEVGPDQFFILPPGVPHSYGSSTDDPWTIYWVHFKGDSAAAFFGNLREPQDIRPGLRSRIANRIKIFEEIMSTLSHGYSTDNLLYSCSVLHYFLGSLRFMSIYRESVADQPVVGPVDVVSASIRFMKENLEKPLRLSDLAAHVGYSQSQYSVLFVNSTGIPPIAYLNQLKISEACRLLDFTDMKINQVCCKIGISDAYYFSRLFTKVMGMSPSLYRSVKKG